MSKFKKGDRVQIIGKSIIEPNNISLEEELGRWGHKLYSIAIVTTVRDNPSYLGKYFLDNKNGVFIDEDLRMANINII